MKLTSQSFADSESIPGEFAFAVPADDGPIRLSANRNPHLAWSDAPAGTRSFAILCCDPDVPSRGDDVNQAGKIVPKSLPRVDFYHWVLIDIPPQVHSVAAGAHADGVVPHGKPPGAAPVGVQGINDYTGWFAGDPAMSGDYGGYDGPCPPWNDALVHRYVFTVYALDLPTLGLSGRFGGADARAAIAGHALATASLTGTYTLNKALLNG